MKKTFVPGLFTGIVLTSGSVDMSRKLGTAAVASLVTLGFAIHEYVQYVLEIGNEGHGTLRGQTVGMKDAGTCLIMDQGEGVTACTWYIRSLVDAFGLQFFNLLVGLADEERRCLHDKLAGTWVVKDEAVKRELAK